MKTAALTQRIVDHLDPGPETRIVWDTKVKGLGVRVNAGGAKSYVLFYRADGKQRKPSLGKVDQITLSDARKRANEILVAVRNGADPQAERERRRNAPTVAEGLDRFFGEFVPRRVADGRMKPRTVREYEKQARLTVRPGLGSMKIEAVTRADVERAVAKRAPVQRNRTVAFVSRLFNLFEDWEWRDQGTNPARRIEKTREEPRDRVLAPTELQSLGQALDTLDSPTIAGAIRFLLMTGWRTGEVLALEWDRVNFETGEAVLPDTKTGRDIRTLGALALETLAGLPRADGDPRVFAGLRYGLLRQEFKAACERAGIADARLHDIRRSVATAAAAHGVGVFVLRDMLGHKSLAMANRYARRSGTAVQQAQDAVAANTAALLAGETGEVVPLRRA